MSRSWQTRMVQPDMSAPAGFQSLVVPTYRGSTTLFDTAESLGDTWDAADRPYTYGLYGTPTTLELATRLTELEGGYAGVITPGGQAALVLVYMAFAGEGGHVLVPESVYGPSRDFAEDVLSRFGVTVEYYAPTIGGGIEALIRPETRLIWCESPGSITFEIQDVDAIVAAAHRQGVKVALDNTWSAGVFYHPLEHNVDVSIQALTKYVGGHSDLLLGVAISRNAEIHAKIGSTHSLLGLGASPDDCSLALRGLQTLAVRLKAIEQSALEVAAWLGARSEVETLLHPAFPSCPGHDLWQRDFTGSSGVFSIVFAPRFSRAEVFRVIDRLRLFKIGYSWGGVTSLAIPGGKETRRADYAFGDRLVRINIGLETTSDLLADLAHALDVMTN